MTTDVQAEPGPTPATARPVFPSQAAAARMLLRYEVRRAERGRVVDGEPAVRRPATAAADGGSAAAASDRIVPD